MDMIKYILLIAGFLVIGCSQETKSTSEDLHAYKKADLNMNSALSSLVDRFSVCIGKYKIDSTNMVAYVKVIESKNNNEFKIHMEGISDIETLRKVNVDFCFYQKGILFCIDNNQTNLINPKSKMNLNKNEILEKSKLKFYKLGDRKSPCWLVLIKNNKIIRSNLFAKSLFGVPTSDEIGYFGDDKTVSHKVDEWGLVYDENGKIIDTVKQ